MTAIGVPRARRFIARLVGVGVVLTIMGTEAMAQRERYAPLVLQLPVSARSMALGGLSVATRDAEAVFGNPSLVGGSNTLSITGGRYASGASTGHAATTMTIGALGVGFGVQFLDAPQRFASSPVRSDVLTDGGAVAASNLAATVAASFSWKGLRWGIGATYAEERSTGVRGGTLAADLGVSKTVFGGAATAGFALQHVGHAISLDATGRALPARLALGVAGAGHELTKWLDVGASANVALRRDGRVLPAAGGELSYVPYEGITFALRAGGRVPELRAQRPATAGVGLTFDRLTLDYGWEDMRGKGGAHRVSVRLR